MCAQCSECQREEIQKARVNGGRNYDSLKPLNSLFQPPFGHLGVTYDLHLWLVGKPVVDFIFVVIELFSLSPTVETL